MTAQTIMVQGTSSSAGKSLLTAALCRIFARRGVRVAPFKAQNMSNNAAVCDDGAEIGRSQALQAAAAGVAPTADMNPILLKPEADACSQVIVQGRPWKRLQANRYYRFHQELWPVVTAALGRLRDQYELVVIEGAGSPAELNLRERDIVNMAVARHAQSPVVLVGDIDRGGIFAQLLGTLWLLQPEERDLVCGLVVNKFRGDASLFADGIDILQEQGGVPVLGVVPLLSGLTLPEEDAAMLETERQTLQADAPIEIAVVRLPRISNFDDFDPLSNEPRVRLRYVTSPDELARPDAVILPGTKSTVSDLNWLRECGLAARIHKLVQEGVTIAGICGGFQMLGRTILDADGVESSTRATAGLELLPVQTQFLREKQTRQVHGVIQEDRHCPGGLGAMISGYEIHSAHTVCDAGWLEIVDPQTGEALGRDGAVSANGRIWGCYVHGLFNGDRFRNAWLTHLGATKAKGARPSEELLPWSARIEQSLDRLADAVEASLDLQVLERVIWEKPLAKVRP